MVERVVILLLEPISLGIYSEPVGELAGARRRPFCSRSIARRPGCDSKASRRRRREHRRSIEHGREPLRACVVHHVSPRGNDCDERTRRQWRDLARAAGRLLTDARAKQKGATPACFAGETKSLL